MPASSLSITLTATAAHQETMIAPEQAGANIAENFAAVNPAAMVVGRSSDRLFVQFSPK